MKRCCRQVAGPTLRWCGARAQAHNCIRSIWEEVSKVSKRQVGYPASARRWKRSSIFTIRWCGWPRNSGLTFLRRDRSLELS